MLRRDIKLNTTMNFKLPPDIQLRVHWLTNATLVCSGITDPVKSILINSLTFCTFINLRQRQQAPSTPPFQLIALWANSWAQFLNSRWQRTGTKRVNGLSFDRSQGLPGRQGVGFGDGGRKRAPFLVLGLSLWCGTIFLFVEQIAASPVGTCCVDFCRWSAGNGVRISEFPEMFYAFDTQLNAVRSVRIELQYFRRTLLQFEWDETVSNLDMSRFRSLTGYQAVSFTRAPHYYTVSFSNVEE